MTCIELVELVTDYLEGSMPADERARFDEHISGCEGCTTYMEQLRITIRLTGMLTEEQIAPDARAARLDAFRDWRSTP
ncbi:MAG: anti-sigma factor family protein [Actinomycetota bacterium]